MDIQFITEQYSCAQYVVEYVNKTDRGISNLQRQLVDIMNEYPDFDLVEATRKLSVDVLNKIEMSSQEAAWFLLNQPMSKSSTIVTYIPTVLPEEREKICKSKQQLDELEGDSTDIWKDNWIDKYERRPSELENATLAQFVANYTVDNKGKVTTRKVPRIIRYRKYDMAKELINYKREMVLLHFQFRCEETDINLDNKFIKIYDENEDLILERRKEFEADINIEETMRICQELCHEYDVNQGFDDRDQVIVRDEEPDPFMQEINDPHSMANLDLCQASLSKLGAIARKKDNIMELNEFKEWMLTRNDRQLEIALHFIYILHCNNPEQVITFFTGPAGSGKSDTLRLIMEIFNRFTENDGICNAYIACASTGHAAVAIGGTTAHTAFKIGLSAILQPLSNEMKGLFRTLFKYVKIILIDEISMIGREMLEKIDSRLKEILSCYDKPFGGMNVFFSGDLRQLPPVRASAIYDQRNIERIGTHRLWLSFTYYELTEVMRQENREFSSLLTKIGDGDVLNEEELALIKSRFVTQEYADSYLPGAIRLFGDNKSVDQFNYNLLNLVPDKMSSIASDIITGCGTDKQKEQSSRSKLYKLKPIDTGGLQYEIIFAQGFPYRITTNIDVADGLANGSIGILKKVELDTDGNILRVWLVFPKTYGSLARKKYAAVANALGIGNDATPISKKSATFPLNNNKTVYVKRTQFPLKSACASTIHSIQGSTCSSVVYKYSKKHKLQQVYVSFSRVTDLSGLYLISEDGTNEFYHNRHEIASMVPLRNEFARLKTVPLQTIDKIVLKKIAEGNLVLFSFNCQSLRENARHFIRGDIIKKSGVLLLSETWLNDGEQVSIGNFSYVDTYKRTDTRAGGVAILHNKDHQQIQMTPHLEIKNANTEFISKNKSAIGDICAAECILRSGKKIIMVSLYITPDKKVEEIMEFIIKVLTSYTEHSYSQRARCNPDTEKLHEMPMIIAGDFNVNFRSNKGQRIIKFFREEFNMNALTNIDDTTTKKGTTIDAVFGRFIDHVGTINYVSYVSHHNPIITVLNDNVDLNIDLNNENVHELTAFDDNVNDNIHVVDDTTDTNIDE